MSEPIIFIKGTSKTNRAAYLVGTEKVPAAVITRLLTSLDGLSDKKLDRAFYQGLEKYPSVLDALDVYELTPAVAAEVFQRLQNENRPVANSSSQRPSKLIKAVKVLSKVICKKYKGSPEEVVDAFLALVTKPDFKSEAINCISEFKNNFGVSKLGFIKTSNRKGNSAAVEALSDYRAIKRAAK